MAFTFKELKQLKINIAAAAGIDTAAAARVIGYYNGGGPSVRPDVVRAMIGGDLSHVGPALVALGLSPDMVPDGVGDDLHAAPDGLQNAPQRKESKQANKRTTKQKKTNTSPQALQNDLVKASHDDLEHVQGDILPADCDGLPDGLADMIYSAVDTFCKKHDFENMSKCRQTAWSACCQFIGQTVFKPNRKILAGPPPKNGGFCYDTDKLSSLADLWSHMCGVYGKAPLVDDFANFAGVDEVTIYASTGKYVDMQHITPARVRLLQKLHAIQEKGLAGLIVDGRQNPTGALAALNHWHGWTQTREIIHTASGSGQTAAALPVFGPDGGLLEDKRPE